MQRIIGFFFAVLVSGSLAGSLGSNDFLINWLAQEHDGGIREDAFVQVQNGTLKGFSKVLPSGRTIYSFKKIPFAKPPVGELRFEPPQPLVDGWGDGQYDASPQPPSCPQYLTDLSPASEDCLFLSVYMPRLPTEELEKLPVMFFIYGGGFMLGDSVIYGPNRLLAHDVILVVPHYRLGALGFLSTQDSVVPGNMGLKDQAQALRWVNENIDAFGGDPNRVTIFGESAGAASVLYALLSPTTKGLFQGVIAQSGTPLSVWAMDNNPLQSARRYAQSFNCPIDSSVKLVECLRRRTWQELAKTSFNNLVEDISNLRLVFEAASPVVEPDLPGAYISKQPLALLREGNFPDVPIMLGAVQHEGSAILGAAHAFNLGASGNLEDPNYVRDGLLPTLLKVLGADETESTGAPISQSLALAFLPSGARDNFTEITDGLVDLLSVTVFKAPILRTADLLKRKIENVYLYSFEREGFNTLWTLIFDLLGAIIGKDPPPIQHGVMHADDLQYFFPLPFIITGDDKKFSETVCKIWTNFATTGNPIPTDDDTLASWAPYNIKEGNYYKLDVIPEHKLDYASSWRKGFTKK